MRRLRSIHRAAARRGGALAALVLSSWIPCGARAQTNVLAEVMKRAGDQYPDNLEMQEFVIKNQLEAHQLLQSLNPTNVPRQVLGAIRKDAASRFPSDFGLQLFAARQQIEAYEALRNYRAADVPPETLARFIDRAAQGYPGDYTTQRFLVDREVKLHRRGSAPATAPAGEQAPPAAAGPPGADASVPADVVENVTRKLARDYPSRPALQKALLDRQLKAYLAVRSYSRKGVSVEDLSRIRKELSARYPSDYIAQASGLEAEVEALLSNPK
jgi:hypothetical protein